MDILVIDDLFETRLLLKKLCKDMGYNAITANDGEDAWNKISSSDVSLVISDWEMPNLNGIELVKRIRKSKLNRYIYFILLTGKNTNEERREGWEAGADDFITKEIFANPREAKQELEIRIRAGERIVQLERDLAKHTEKLEKELQSAAEIQKSLLPKSALEHKGIGFGSVFIPSTYVGGDIFNYFMLDDNNAGFYVLDVSGHGASAAMLSYSVSKFISAHSVQLSGILRKFSVEKNTFEINPPSEVLNALNQAFESDEDNLLYFTMAYGVLNLQTGKLMISQAGHPPAIIINRHDSYKLVDIKSLPAGMFDISEYEDLEFQLEPGDVVFLYSDGTTECFSDVPGKGETEMAEYFDSIKKLPFDSMLQNIEKKLYSYHNDIVEGKSEQNGILDDITLLAVSYHGN
ncbi:MAG: SpoIIE family protein phosphatase [Ignavibacteriaceae bacterium]|nr:SpoIIE family protein phosphatase [Ignavibacteriaceae bacterium]